MPEKRYTNQDLNQAIQVIISYAVAVSKGTSTLNVWMQNGQRYKIAIESLGYQQVPKRPQSTSFSLS